MKHAPPARWNVGGRSGSASLSARTLEHRPLAAIAQLPTEKINMLLALGAAAWMVAIGFVLFVA